ncbi:RNA-directed DNA polymerase, eukaryota, reverse transcriptase zinc-binding domain protein [Tanacetum coccineum]
MLDIRDKIKPYVLYKVGNGQSISVWHDKWCAQGPLDRFISNRDIYDARLTNEACLADVIRNGNWIWPAEWESDFPELNQIIIPNLTQRNDAVNWYHVVWFSQCNPKQAFILWMEIQGKLLTQDRMAWAQGNDLTCALCKKCTDSHRHLFFECSYSEKIWIKVVGKGRFNGRGNNLSNVISQLKTCPAKNNIWQIVNKLILSNTLRTVELLRAITKNIEDMLMCLRVRSSNSVLRVADTWGLRCLDWKLMPDIAASSIVGAKKLLHY